jgi:hypothetical protein
MLITPAKSRGIMETVPFRSSILSRIKMATIEVKATVICRKHYIPYRSINEQQLSQVKHSKRRG